MEDGSVQALLGFLNKGRYAAQQVDERVTATQLYNEGGPEVRSAREQLAAWGVPWPPPKGRKDELAECWKAARPDGPPAPSPTPAPTDFSQETFDFG